MDHPRKIKKLLTLLTYYTNGVVAIMVCAKHTNGVVALTVNGSPF